MSRILFFIAVILSLLSQVFLIRTSGLGEYFKLMWIPAFVYIFALGVRHCMDKTMIYLISFLLIFYGYLFTVETFSMKHLYIASGGDIYNIAVSMLIGCCSYLFWLMKGSKNTLQWLCLCMIAVSAYICYDNLVNFKLIEALSNLQYSQGVAKNSLSTILLAVGVIIAVCYRPGNKVLWLVTGGMILVIIVVIFVMRSRATLCSLFFIIGYFIWQTRNRRIRKILILSIAAACVYIVLSPKAYTLIVEQIFFAGRNSEALDEVSSGRVHIIAKALKLISENIWFGNGRSYVDCMPVAMLLQYGIFGLTIVLVFLYSLSRKILHLDFHNKIELTAFLLFFAYLVNALFEAYPPFGPGVKCFPL